MDRVAARIQARNLYAKYSGCTRREAERVLTDVTDEDCMALAVMEPDAAEQAVKAAVVEGAKKIVAAAAKEPSPAAEQGLSAPADEIIEVSDGQIESGLNADGSAADE